MDVTIRSTLILLSLLAFFAAPRHGDDGDGDRSSHVHTHVHAHGSFTHSHTHQHGPTQQAGPTAPVSSNDYAHAHSHWCPEHHEACHSFNHRLAARIRPAMDCSTGVVNIVACSAAIPGHLSQITRPLGIRGRPPDVLRQIRSVVLRT